MSDKTALVVIDMQEDYLRDNRKKMFRTMRMPW